MGRSRVTTTYRREFSPERSMERPCMTSLIRSNFDYAAYRRHLEGGHDNAPFLWDDWEYEAAASERAVGREICAADPVPARAVDRPSKRTTHRRHRGRTALQAVAASADVRGRQETGSQTSCRWNVEIDSPTEPRAASRPAAATSAAAEKGKVTTRAAPEGGSRSKSKVQQSSQTRVKSAKAPLHAREWVLMPTAPASAPRPVSAPPAAGKAYAGHSGGFISDNPFAQYGTADDEQETGHKQTFNVRADDEIYKSALRAKKRQQVHVQEQLKAECREPLASRRHRALFNDDFDLAMNKETAKWTSEYNRNYRGWRREA